MNERIYVILILEDHDVVAAVGPCPTREEASTVATGINRPTTVRSITGEPSFAMMWPEPWDSP